MNKIEEQVNKVIQFMRNNVDKFAHFGISSFLVLLFAILGFKFPNQNFGDSVIIAAELTLVAGFSKELYDCFISKENLDDSLKDLFIDICGIVITTILLLSINI